MISNHIIPDLNSFTILSRSMYKDFKNYLNTLNQDLNAGFQEINLKNFLFNTDTTSSSELIVDGEAEFASQLLPQIKTSEFLLKLSMIESQIVHFSEIYCKRNLSSHQDSTRFPNKSLVFDLKSITLFLQVQNLRLRLIANSGITQEEIDLESNSAYKLLEYIDYLNITPDVRLYNTIHEFFVITKNDEGAKMVNNSIDQTYMH
ncbi:hypothetical protein AYI69_g9229 [Smittium culicis]|uniref:Uncharacterized protein n=1 Tax=Smittium culicis TaxID=133412 RepID=A0A1R1XE04_9FUNG|nr:hypothetical protein AYI69_g9229 [Smittium culicis]